MSINSFRSLKISLILPYALLVTVVSIALSVTYYWSASRNISYFSQHYIQEVATRIGQSVHFHLGGSEAVLEAAFPRYMPADSNISGDLDQLRTRFWIATSMAASPNKYVYYGNKAGQYIGLMRMDSDEVELRLKMDARQFRSYLHYKGILGVRYFVKRERALYDPRTRVWYIMAKHADNDIWTSVHINYSSGHLVITRARRVLSETGQYQGVVATDVSLREINHFISTLDMGKGGRAFIVDRSGRLVAATSVPNVSVEAGGEADRIMASESGDPVIEAAYSSIASEISAMDSPLTSPAGGHRFQATAIDENGQTIWVAARHIVDDAGLDWLAVVAVPQSSVLAGINQQFWVALGIGLMAVILTIGLGMVVFGRIARDIQSLSEAVGRVREGALDMTLDIRRKDEVGHLAQNFKAMHTDLFTDKLTDVANRTALTSLLHSITKAPGSQQPFTLFFTDLNRFKPLNDRYGHHNGDRALAEIAKRLQRCVRPDDFVARIGGDEFVVIAMGVTTLDGIISMLAKLKATVEMPLETLEDLPAGETVSVGVAIGYAVWPKEAKTPDDLIKRADASMYKHKRREP